MDLSEAVYRVTWAFPRHEVFGLASQLQRAAVSVPSNIAEVRMRGSRREYAQGVSVARGSLGEVRTQLLLAQRLGYVTAEESAPLLESAVMLSKRLNALRSKLLQESE